VKIIIVGAGQVGFNIAQKLSEESHDVVLIWQGPGMSCLSPFGGSTHNYSDAEYLWPGLGIVGPVQNYLSIPAAGKWILIFCMLLGRLEIYTVIVLLVPEYWRK
jgi:glycine/D-amino acid oxidase-like deaminating enzyme